MVFLLVLIVINRRGQKSLIVRRIWFWLPALHCSKRLFNLYDLHLNVIIGQTVFS